MLMLSRTQIERDGLELIARGWLLAKKGIWVPFGNPVASDSGGYLPGGLTAFLFGIPLMFWPDHRATAVPILLAHIFSYFLLDRLIKEIFHSSRARLVFAILYWINPWRLYHSVLVDNSSYVYLAGAIHLWAIYRQRDRSSFLVSMALAVTLGFSVQLHLDAVILVFASILLWWQGYWKPNWSGLIAGGLIILATLIPFFVEAIRYPEIWPMHKGKFAKSLLMIWPPLKGLVYWLRYASLSFPTPMLSFDFTPVLGPSMDKLLTPVFFFLGKIIGSTTIIIALAANLWLWGRYKTSIFKKGEKQNPQRWLAGYSVIALVSGFISNTISPTPIMWWHNLIIFHAALIPLLMWSVTWPSYKNKIRMGKVAYTAVCVFLLLGMSVASERYRRGGRGGLVTYLRAHEILEDIPLERICDFRPDPDAWPNQEKLFYRKYLARYRLPESYWATYKPEDD